MSEKFKLSRKKKKWVKKFKPSVTMRGSALNYPATIGVKYDRAVRQIMKNVMAITQREVKEIFQTSEAIEFYAEDASFTVEANKTLDAMISRLQGQVLTSARRAATTMVNATNKSSQRALAMSLKELSGGVTLDPSKLGGDIPEMLQASIASNVDLITSISNAYLSKVSDAVNRSILFGRGLQDLVPFMQEQRGITLRHARNIALDQTRKAYNALNEVRMEQVGISQFEWLHSGGGQKPRKFHIDRFPKGLNGGIYDLKDPPVIDPKTGERGLPSYLPNCKCRMIPVIVLDDGKSANA
jgi:uncharacterized protein with gpF-like domain